MSTTRLPPTAAIIVTEPEWSSTTSPMSAASRPSGCAHLGEHGVGGSGRNDCQQLALVGNMQRVEAQNLARALDGLAGRDADLVKMDADLRLLGELTATARGLRRSTPRRRSSFSNRASHRAGRDLLRRNGIGRFF